MIHHAIEVFADFFQFYLWDRICLSPPVDMTDADLDNRIKEGQNSVTIFTVRNMYVPVDIQVHNEDPGYNADQWEHIVECSVDFPTGQLEIVEGGNSDPLLEFEVPGGNYRVRTFFTGLNTLSENGLDGDDKYHITLWPDSPASLRLIKQSLAG